MNWEKFGWVKKIVEAAIDRLDKLEFEYNRAIGLNRETRFLSAHSLRVANIAKRICEEEGGNCLLVFIAALFHDAGKFIWKTDERFESVREEILSSMFAEKVLGDFGVDESIVNGVKEVIEEIYSEGHIDLKEAQIIRDADILDKVGYHGVYTFFSKWTLRGENIFDIVEKRLSGELTYLINVQKILYTETAKKYAKDLAKKSIAFYKDFLNELAQIGLKYVLESRVVDGIEVVLVLKQKRVDEIYENVENRLKCRWLRVEIRYSDGDLQEIGFCLPRK